jgi:hypothetical protein
MTDQDNAVLIWSGIKAWFAGSVAATMLLFLHGLVLTVLAPSGLSFSLLLSGLLLSTVYFTCIVVYTAIPVGIFILITRKLRIDFLILFAAFGGLLGWPINSLTPYTSGRILSPFVVGGVVAGIVAWYFARQPRHSSGPSV